MWRYFQGLPRVLRGQWSGLRSSPAVRCGDEEGTEKCCLGFCVKKHCRHQRTDVNPINFARRTYHTNKQSCHGIKTVKCTTPSCVCRNDSVGVGGGYRQRKEGEGGEKADNCDWSEWIRRPRHTCWEAIGWGTTLVFGTELIHLWCLEQRRRNEWHENKRAWYYHISQAYNHGRGVARSVLPKDASRNITSSPSNQPQQPVTKAYKFDANKFVSVEFDTWSDSNISHESSEEGDESCQCDKKVTFDPSTSESDILFAEAEHEWNKLEAVYEGCGLNYQGLKAVKVGDHAEAVHVWMKAAHTGYGKALFNLGLSYELGTGTKKDLQKAVEAYAIAAVAGHPQAMFNLGVLTLAGEGVPLDTDRGVSLMEKAASLGLPQAQRELGVLYMEEDRRDETRAVSYFQKAAEQEDAVGEYYLGVCYESGLGVCKNVEKAMTYYSRACEQGHGEACYSLAKIHEQGTDWSKRSKDEAADLYKKSLDQGIKRAKDDLNRLNCDTCTRKRQSSLESLTLSSLLDDVIPSPTESTDSLRISSSSPSLSSYMKQNLVDHGFSDFDAAQTMILGPDVKRKTKAKAGHRKVSISLGSSDTESECGSTWSGDSDYATEDVFSLSSGSGIRDPLKDSTGLGDSLVLSGGFGNIPTFKQGPRPRRGF